MKKSELVKAAKEINTIIEPPIDVKLGTDELEAELLEASEAISEEDGLSEATMNVLEEIKAKYAETEDADDEADDEDEAEEEEAEEEDADEEEEEDEETDDEDEDDEGEDEEREDGDEGATDEIDEDEESVDEEDEEDEDEPTPAKKGSKGKSKPAKVETPKKEKPAKAEKPKKDTSKRDSIFKGNKTATRIEYFVELINEGRYSKKDLIELAAKKFPEATISALSTIIADGANPKYCRFPVLLKVDTEDGNIVKFTDQKCARGYPISNKIVVTAGVPSSKKKEEKTEMAKKAPKEKEAPVKAAPAKATKAGKKAGGKKK